MFGTLNAGASRLWNKLADTAQIRRNTADAPIMKPASMVAKRLAHLTECIYESNTTASQTSEAGNSGPGAGERRGEGKGTGRGILMLKRAEIEATTNMNMAGHVLVCPHADSSSPSS